MRKDTRAALFSSAKDVAGAAVMCALLIAAQAALSAAAGVEVVTALFLPYCYVCGARRGLAAAVCFSLLRCFLWGFVPTVIILYLVYYCLFALVFGGLGRLLRPLPMGARLAAVTAAAVGMTALFTLLDDVITPLFYGYGARAALVYFYNSLPVMALQCACALVSVPLLFPPLTKALSAVWGKGEGQAKPAAAKKAAAAKKKPPLRAADGINGRRTVSTGGGRYQRAVGDIKGGKHYKERRQALYKKGEKGAAKGRIRTDAPSSLR